MKLLRLALLSFGTASAIALAQDTGSAFQGLRWGSSEREVVALFGGRTKPSECNTFTTEIARRTGGVCDYPTIEPYEVVGIPFKLAFYLEPTRRSLSSIGLFYEGDAEAPLRGSRPDAQWIRQYKMLRESLAERYGEQATQLINSHGSVKSAISSWKTTDSLIELKAMFVHGTSAPSREQYEIIYRPLSSGASSRL